MGASASFLTSIQQATDPRLFRLLHTAVSLSLLTSQESTHNPIVHEPGDQIEPYSSPIWGLNLLLQLTSLGFLLTPTDH